MPQIIVQNVVDKTITPSVSQLKKWANTALKNFSKNDIELTIRIVDIHEMTKLNSEYRHKMKPTNVLSFPFDMPDDISEDSILGDIVICADVVNEEALTQGKTKDAHWAHMVIHGTLHLLGYDHENDQDADKMEQIEISILNSLGFPNPYV